MWSLMARIWRGAVATEPPERLLDPAPPGFRGLPALEPAHCDGCGNCVTACPAQALAVVPDERGGAASPGGTWILDLGRCQFCGVCAEVCPSDAITQSNRYALATRDPADLRVAVQVTMGVRDDA